MQKEMTALRTIREVAEIIDVPQHVLRFWETRFPEIKPFKHNGGRRYYSPENIELLKGIRYLLYGEGYTIRGVQRVLREEGVQSVCQAGHTLSSVSAPSQSNALPNLMNASLPGTSLGLTEPKIEAQQLSMRSFESEPQLPLSFPFKSPSEEEKPSTHSARSLPKSPLPPLPQAPLPPPELFLGFAPDPTPRTKMGDDPHFHTSSERDAFLCRQLREALDHLKECKQMLDTAIALENDSSKNTS